MTDGAGGIWGCWSLQPFRGDGGEGVGWGGGAIMSEKGSGGLCVCGGGGGHHNVHRRGEKVAEVCLGVWERMRRYNVGRSRGI